MGLLNEQGDELARRVQRLLVRAGLKDLSVISVEPTEGRRLILRHGPSMHRLEVRPSGKGLREDSPAAAMWPALHVATSLDDETVSQLSERDSSYLDERGNAQLVLDGALVLVARPKHAQMTRRTKDSPRDRPAGTGRSALALHRTSHQVAFTLLAKPALAAEPLRVLAEVAGVSLGTAAETSSQLRRAGHLLQGQLHNTRELLDSWSEAYRRLDLPQMIDGEFFATGSEWADQLLLDPSDSTLLGGAAAAARLTPFLRATDGVVYTTVPTRPIQALRLSRTPSPHQVIIRERFWREPLPAPQPGMVPSLLIYADLLHDGDDRSLEAAQELRRTDAHLRALDGS